MSPRKLGPSNGHLAPVTADMKILDLLDIDEQQSTFDLYFKLGKISQLYSFYYFQFPVDIMWYDVNLRYIFLNDLDDKNGFNEEELEKVESTKCFKSNFPLFLFFLVMATRHTIFPCRK